MNVFYYDERLSLHHVDSIHLLASALRMHGEEGWLTCIFRGVPLLAGSLAPSAHQEYYERTVPEWRCICTGSFSSLCALFPISTLNTQSKSTGAIIPAEYPSTARRQARDIAHNAGAIHSHERQLYPPYLTISLPSSSRKHFYLAKREMPAFSEPSAGPGTPSFYCP